MSTALEQKMTMSRLIRKLNQATIAYDEGYPLISDKEWDDMYFELARLEKETGIILPDSPTQKINYEVVSELKKVKHNHPMLSLDKTKDIKEIESFLKGHDWIAMPKMDGLTCSLRYINGELISAETRGNGVEGEDITHNAKVMPSIPNYIDFKEELIVDGEIICTYEDFEKFKKDYKNPRNFASGSIRLLDSKECYNRNLTFVAWDVVKGGKYNFLYDNLKMDLITEKFISVLPCCIINNIFPNDFDGFIDNKNIPEAREKTRELDENDLNKIILEIKKRAKILGYPIDGIVFKYNNIKEYEAAGRTAHHYHGGLAYKFYDENYETHLRYIKWSMGRTGILTPVAVFDPIEIDGTIVEKASLHNISVMEDLLGDSAYYGEPLEIYKSNMIIPQVKPVIKKYRHDYSYVLSNGGAIVSQIPEVCPICGKEVVIKNNNGIKTAYCNNSNCEGKLVNILEHFLGKKGLDAKGISKKILEKTVEWGWVKTLKDIYSLHEHKKEWINKDGFGEISVNKILQSIENSKQCTLAAFITAFGIPEIGKVAAEKIAENFITYEAFREAIEVKDREKINNIPGIGEIMTDNIINYDYGEVDFIYNHYINLIEIKKENIENKNIKNKIFCITGKVTKYKNRAELKEYIISMGGKVTDSVSKNTDFLINNDNKSDSIKNKKAKSLGVKIIDEETFQNMVKKAL